MATYSHSRLETFEKCPLKYQFKYVQEIEEPTEFVEQFLGKRVHEALEKLHREQTAGRPPTLPELLSFLRQQWRTNWNDHVKIVRKGTNQTEYAHYAETCVRNYYQKTWPRDKSSTLLLEAHIQFPLDERGVYRMQGYIDRVARQSDGTYEIHDYKTTNVYLPSETPIKTNSWGSTNSGYAHSIPRSGKSNSSGITLGWAKHFDRSARHSSVAAS